MPPTNDGNGDQQNPMTPPADPGMGGGMGDQGGNMPPAPQPGDSGQAPMGTPPADTPPADPGMGGGMEMPSSEPAAPASEPTDTTGGDSGTGAPAA